MNTALTAKQAQNLRDRLKVFIEEDHTIRVEGGLGFTDIDLSPIDALALLQALEAKRAQITDFAMNYYDCRECGHTHHISVAVCPTLTEHSEDENQ